MKYNIPRLFLMMFLQYFLQGTWSMTISAVLVKYGMAKNIGATYILLGLAAIFSPLFIAMIADRFLASQKMLAILHILNSLILYQIGFSILKQNEITFFLFIFIVGFLYYPTVSLSNSITFHHLNDSKLFPLIRVMGNLGFISSGLIMGYYLFFDNIIIFKISAIISLIYGLYCFYLPDTSPLIHHKNINWRIIFCLDALKLFKNKYFSLFMLITLFVMIAKTAYSIYIPIYLQDFNLNPANLIQVAVVSEVIMMLLLSVILKKIGFKYVLLIGIIIWSFRSYLFAFATSQNEPFIYILISLILQGICWPFFFAAGDIYVNDKAKNEIKAQAQSLRFILTNGIGVLISSYIVSLIHNHVFISMSLYDINSKWSEFWLYPTIIVAISAVLFLIFFKDK